MPTSNNAQPPRAPLPGGAPSARSGEPLQQAGGDAGSQPQVKPADTRSGTDAARGQTGPMAVEGGDAGAQNRQAGAGTASQGSRAGSPVGSQAGGTGLGDGAVHSSSQGLTGAQGSGGAADQPPLQPRRGAPGG